MEAHDGGPDSHKGRVRRLYDRLAAILRGLRPERLEALEEHLHEQGEAQEQLHAPGRATPGDDRPERT